MPSTRPECSPALSFIPEPRCVLERLNAKPEFGNRIEQPHGIFVDLPVGKDHYFLRSFDYGSNDRGRR